MDIMEGLHPATVHLRGENLPMEAASAVTHGAPISVPQSALAAREHYEG